MRVLQRTGLLAAQGPLNFFSQMISLLGDFFRFLASEDSSELETLTRPCRVLLGVGQPIEY